MAKTKIRTRVIDGEFGLPTKKGPPRYTDYYIWIFPLYFVLFSFYLGWFFIGVPSTVAELFLYPFWGFKYFLLEVLHNFASPVVQTLFLWRFCVGLVAAGIAYRWLTRQRVEDKADILRGSAHFAAYDEIKSAALLQESGAVVGGWVDKKKNRKYTLMHSGPEHILVCAPTRSGKGISLVVPTLLTWPDSLFVLDIKGENFVLSAGYRKTIGNVIKFDPTESGEGTAHYNPLLEVNLDTDTLKKELAARKAEEELAAKEGRPPRSISGSYTEVRDIQIIAQMIVDPDGKGMDAPDSHWQKTAYALLQGIIAHTLYVNRRRQASPDPKVRANILGLDYVADTLRHCGDNKKLAAYLLTYPHLASEEERAHFYPNTPPPKNLMKDSSYIRFNETKNEFEFADSIYEKYHLCPLGSDDPDDQPYELQESDLSAYSGLRPAKPSLPRANPWCHPTVKQAAEEIGQKDVREASSVISTAIAYFGLWMDPTIVANTRDSTFKLLDLVNQDKPTSLYLVIPPSDLTRLRPLLRLIVSQLVDALTQKMDAVAGGGVKSRNKHKILLMLDEFPTLRKLDKIQLALAYMGGYGAKAFIICQSLRQLTDIYGKDETVSANCHIHIFFAPNDEDTARALSERCGETTVVTSGYNTSGQPFKFGLFDSISTQMVLETRKLLTADEVKRLTPAEKDSKGLITKPGSMLIFTAGIPPIYGEQTPYFFQKPWKETYKLAPPDKSDVLYRPEEYTAPPREPEDPAPPEDEPPPDRRTAEPGNKASDVFDNDEAASRPGTSKGAISSEEGSAGSRKDDATMAEEAAADEI